MMESFSQVEDFLPMLGLLDAERLNRLIAEPPQKGKPDRGWMGIYLQALTTDIAEFWGIDIRGGIIINEVVKDSPAFQAGLKTGDIITHVAGIPIEVDKEEKLPVFQKKISEMGAGTIVDFAVLRRAQGQVDTLDISLTLAEAPLSPAEAPEYEDTHFEMKIRDMVFADYNLYNLDQKTFKGVVVKEIERGGWFDVGGIMPGDIIQSIDGEKIVSIENARKILNRISENKPEDVVFFIWRNNKTLFINIKTDW
jgi:S1-C subfamily serine protease